jgi:hypothetical protein
LRIEQVLNAAIANGQRRRHVPQPSLREAVKAVRSTKGGSPYGAQGERPGNSLPVWVEHIAPRAFDVSDERPMDAGLIQVP